MKKGTKEYDLEVCLMRIRSRLESDYKFSGGLEESMKDPVVKNGIYCKLETLKITENEIRNGMMFNKDSSPTIADFPPWRFLTEGEIQKIITGTPTLRMEDHKTSGGRNMNTTKLKKTWEVTEEETEDDKDQVIAASFRKAFKILRAVRKRINKSPAYCMALAWLIMDLEDLDEIPRVIPPQVPEGLIDALIKLGYKTRAPHENQNI